MKKSVFVLLVVMVLSALVLAACGGGGSESGGSGSGAQAQVPAEYAGKTNPVAGNDAAVTAGKDIYNTNCASCHGEGGKGDGPAGASLEPKPAVLAGDTKGDDYIFWRISEGGAMAPFNSSMPAFKGVLTEEQIWQTIAYVRTLK